MAHRTRFGIVGLGAFGSSAVTGVLKAPNAELVAVADRDPARAEAIGTERGVPWTADYRELLKREDVDVIGVFTPSNQHHDVVLEAAAAGKHVLSTKPLEVSLERADEMVRGCREAGVELFCEFYLRYMPDNYRIHQAVAAGALGDLVLGDFSYKAYRPDWYYAADGGWRGQLGPSGGGIVINQSIHAIDKLRWYLGDVASVQALTGTYQYDIEVEDTAAAILRMRSGAIGMLVGTSTFHNTNPVHPHYGGGSTARSEVNGTRGSIIVIDNKVTMWAVDGDVPEPVPGEIPVNVFQDVSSALQDPAYASATLVRGEDARAALAVVVAIYESARLGRAVEVREP